MSEVENRTLRHVIEELVCGLSEADILQVKLGDFVEYVPMYAGGAELIPESIQYIASALVESGVSSEPRIRKGILSRSIDSPIFIYKSGSDDIDHHASGYRHGLLVVRVAAIMARADGSSSDEEIGKIEKLVWDMNYLSSLEKRALFAKANHFLSLEYESGGRAREFIMLALNRKALLDKIPEMSVSTSASLLKVAKDIAIADGYLDRGELKLLQEMYRALGLSARGTKRDLEAYAKEQYVSLISQTSVDVIPEVELDEIDNILGDLFIDFDEF